MSSTLSPSGSLLTLDPALREFLLRCDDQCVDGEKFVIKRNLGETHLLVQTEAVPFLKTLVEEWQNGSSYDEVDDRKKEEIKQSRKKKGR